MKTIDVIIPVYKPGKEFLMLIEKLSTQTVPISRIIIMNTEQKYFDRLIYGSSFTEKYRNVSVTHLSKREFNHGATRNQGVKKSQGHIFVMMTQDAIPADAYMIERLVAPLEQERVAVSYARQLPTAGCGDVESFTRTFNYSENARIKSKEDIQELGIKTFFCSNVCAAYDRSIFEERGGFAKCTIFNEDMIYAGQAVMAGYRIAYAADAKVIHSHEYNYSQMFRRNFDLGVSQADYPDLFLDIPSEKEGIALVKRTAAYLKNTGKRRLVPRLYMGSGCKFVGFFLGKHYRKLPMKLILFWTMNKEYWNQYHLSKSSDRIDPKHGYGKNENGM